MLQPILGAVITEPTTLFAFLAAILGTIFWLSQAKFMGGFFKYLPPIIWVYYVPLSGSAF